MNEMVSRNAGMKFVLGETGGTPSKPTQIPFRPPRNPHLVTEMQTHDPVMGESI